jgi:hypothetical protein
MPIRNGRPTPADDPGPRPLADVYVCAGGVIGRIAALGVAAREYAALYRWGDHRLHGEKRRGGFRRADRALQPYLGEGEAQGDLGVHYVFADLAEGMLNLHIALTSWQARLTNARQRLSRGPLVWGGRAWSNAHAAAWEVGAAVLIRGLPAARQVVETPTITPEELSLGIQWSGVAVCCSVLVKGFKRASAARGEGRYWSDPIAAAFDWLAAACRQERDVAAEADGSSRFAAVRPSRANPKHERFRELRRDGNTYGQIALAWNDEHPEDVVTPDCVRKALKRSSAE